MNLPIKTQSGAPGFVDISFDDYHPMNFQIAEMLNTHGLKATFYIDTQHPDSRDQIKKISEMGHEIGGHTIHHPQDLKAIPSIEVVGEVEGCKKMIESITKKTCTSFAYPRGRYNKEVADIVKRAGFLEARTTKVLKTSFEDPYEKPTTVHLYDGRVEYNGKDWTEIANLFLDEVKKNGGIFSVWGHAFELVRDDTWNRLDELLQVIPKQ